MTEQTEFERIIGLYYASLYRFALSLSRRESDACDLTQQTFYIWAARGHQLRDSSRVKTWLFTTLYREFLEIRRKQTRFPQVDLDQASTELPVVDLDWANRLDGQALVEMLGQVDEVFQGPVALFYLEDCSYNEIAEILDVPLGTVKSRIARGLAQLQRLLTRRVQNDRSKRGAS